ncbi:MAG: hypothetical protein H7Y60_18340 [Rhodospirillaceae bacterium]|nr:hypothetical protein [Rhodospirillales bacterium]
MAELVLIPIAAHKVGDRQVFNTGMSTVGRGGGNDYMCGHCGALMMRDYDTERLEIEIAYQCGACKGHNLKPEMDGEAPGEAN